MNCSQNQLICSPPLSSGDVTKGGKKKNSCISWRSRGRRSALIEVRKRGSIVVSALESSAGGPGFDPRGRRGHCSTDIFERRAVTSPTTLVSKGRHCHWDYSIIYNCSFSESSQVL